MQKQQLKWSVIRVLNARGSTKGAGFIVAGRLAVTCAHVVRDAGSGPGQPVHIRYFGNDQYQKAMVLREGWSPREEGHDDVAFIQLPEPPDGIVPVVLGSAEKRQGHE